jgi:hypothetical protein
MRVRCVEVLRRTVLRTGCRFSNRYRFAHETGSTYLRSGDLRSAVIVRDRDNIRRLDEMKGASASPSDIGTYAVFMGAKHDAL